MRQVFKGSTEVPTAFGSEPFHHNFVVLRNKSSKRPWCLGRWHLAVVVVGLFWAIMSLPKVTHSSTSYSPVLLAAEEFTKVYWSIIG